MFRAEKQNWLDLFLEVAILTRTKRSVLQYMQQDVHEHDLIIEEEIRTIKDNPYGKIYLFEDSREDEEPLPPTRFLFAQVLNVAFNSMHDDVRGATSEIGSLSRKSFSVSSAISKKHEFASKETPNHFMTAIKQYSYINQN